METRRNFASGKMNKDVDERILPDGEYRDGLNITVGSSESSNIGAVQNVLGNEAISNIAIITGTPTNPKVIGAVAVESPRLIYWMMTSDTYDAIFELDVESGNVYKVFKSTKVSGVSQLNFDQTYLITGINYINGMLFWTDNNGQPRRINVARCKSYPNDSVKFDKDSYVILRPPLNAPYIVMKNDGTQSNNMSEKFLYFAYRYKYIDNEYSSLSPFTTASFIPKDFEFDTQKGYNKAMVNSINNIALTMETGNEFVEAIQLVMLDSTSKSVFIVETFDKDELGIQDDDSYTFTDFSNNKTYSSLSPSQVSRLFDNVPLKAKSQDFIGNRIVYGNYTQFYDITDSNENKIKIDYSVGFNQNINTIVPTLTEPKQTFRSDRDYELGIIYTDDYGRMSTVLTSNTNTVYIPPTASATANSLVINIKNKAPHWATSWRVGIKQSKNQYYTLFPILFYKDGNYRYFLINDSDRDKITIGEYITFKTDAVGFTNSNKQYKILDIGVNGSGLTIGSNVNVIDGLYFKIKADSQDEFNPNTIYSYASSSQGSNTNELTSGGSNPPFVTDAFACAENPIFYGSGDGTMLTIANNNEYLGSTDARYTIEIDSSTTFRYTANVDASQPYIEQFVAIVANTSIPIKDIAGNTMFNVVFSSNTGYVVGDKWKVSCRDFYPEAISYVSGLGWSTPTRGYLSSTNGGGNIFGKSDKSFAIIPATNWSPTTVAETDRPINAGAIITIYVKYDTYNSSQSLNFTQSFPPSDRNYANIEEWFIESGAYSQYVQYFGGGWNAGSRFIRFRRGINWGNVTPNGNSAICNTISQGGSADSTTMNYPVRMLIMGDGAQQGGSGQSVIGVDFRIQQTESQIIAETAPKETDTEIYHELTRTYPVDDYNHIVNWSFDDYLFFSSSDSYINGKVELAQLTNGRPHYFEVGETVNVVSSVGYISGQQEVIAVPSPYSIVIDVAHISGATIGGTVAHNLIDTDQVNNSPQGATLVINNPNNKNSNYNAYTWGNGIESNRIKDDFNASTLEYSVRALSTLEDYKQETVENGLTYSGVYQESSSLNKLNEFNLSEANFKYLDKSFGSIQKLYARDTDLLVFQEHKISSVLYGKNVLYDAVGGGQVASIPEVLGTQVAFPYENGISRNPESFASWGTSIWCTDAYRGVVLEISGDRINEISDYGMKDYFRDMFRGNPDTQKLGVYDPYLKTYTISSNNLRSVPCKLLIQPDRLVVPFIIKNNLPITLFNIISESNWTLTKVSTGYGTSWVTLTNTFGSGNADVTATIDDNTTSANRSMEIEVEYCGGATKTFTLIQTAGGEGGVILLGYTNVNEDESKAIL